MEVMSDRASDFSSGRGLSRFEALPEEYEVNYYLAEEAVVNGKGSRKNHFLPRSLYMGRCGSME